MKKIIGLIAWVFVLSSCSTLKKTDSVDDSSLFLRFVGYSSFGEYNQESCRNTFQNNIKEIRQMIPEGKDGNAQVALQVLAQFFNSHYFTEAKYYESATLVMTCGSNPTFNNLTKTLTALSYLVALGHNVVLMSDREATTFWLGIPDDNRYLHWSTQSFEFFDGGSGYSIIHDVDMFLAREALYENYLRNGFNAIKAISEKYHADFLKLPGNEFFPRQDEKPFQCLKIGEAAKNKKMSKKFQHFVVGDCFYNQGKYKEAIQYLNKALNTKDNSNKGWGISELSLLRLTHIYYDQADYLNAVKTSKTYMETYFELLMPPRYIAKLNDTAKQKLEVNSKLNLPLLEKILEKTGRSLENKANLMKQMETLLEAVYQQTNEVKEGALRLSKALKVIGDQSYKFQNDLSKASFLNAFENKRLNKLNMAILLMAVGESLNWKVKLVDYNDSNDFLIRYDGADSKSFYWSPYDQKLVTLKASEHFEELDVNDDHFLKYVEE